MYQIGSNSTEFEPFFLDFVSQTFRSGYARVMGYSAKIKIDPKKPRQDGTNSIYLQIIIDRKKKDIPLGIAWPAARFSPTDGCRPRMKNDPDVDEYNIVIGNARAKANKIHKNHLVRGLHLTLDGFLREYRSDLNKNDFIQYFAQKSLDRWNKTILSDATYEKEKGTLKRLKQFVFSLDPASKGKQFPDEINVVLPFHEISFDFASSFDNFLQKQFKNEKNGRWNRHKHIITYLNMARDMDKLQFDDPYSRFSNKLVDGTWKPLSLEQMLSLFEHYIRWRDNPLPSLANQKDFRDGLTHSEIVVLRRFLFGCNTALRISDLQALDESKFANGEMNIVPEKTERYGTKIESGDVVPFC